MTKKRDPNIPLFVDAKWHYTGLLTEWTVPLDTICEVYVYFPTSPEWLSVDGIDLAHIYDSVIYPLDAASFGVVLFSYSMAPHGWEFSEGQVLTAYGSYFEVIWRVKRYCDAAKKGG